MSLVRRNSLLFSQKQEELAQQLVRHIVRGEKLKAQEMLNGNPGLALISCTVEDYSGRTITANALRAALGAKHPAMWEMVIDAIRQHNPSQLKRILIENFKAQFPAGVKKPVECRDGEVVQSAENYDFNDIVVAIMKASDEQIAEFLQHPDDDSITSPLTEPFAAFRRYFSPQKVETGFHCNMQDLRNAFNIYNSFGYELGLHLKTAMQKKLFYRMVIGYIERLNPAYYAQAFCWGLYDFLDGDIITTESMLFRSRNDNGICYYPLDQNPSERLGYHVASNYRGTPPVGEYRLWGECAAGTPWCLQLESFDNINSRKLWDLSCELGLSEEMNAQKVSGPTL